MAPSFMEYRERWLSKDGQRLAAEVVRRLQRGRSVAGLGLPTVEGRIDLRGLIVPNLRTGRSTSGPAVGNLPEIRRARLAGVDLSGSQLRHLKLTRVTFEDCVLREADLTGFGAWQSRFERCDLTGADLAGSIISSWEGKVGNVWHNCSFNTIVLDGVVAVGAEFRNCTFDGVKMTNIVFDGCRFIDCRVSGSLDNVAFYAGNPPKGAKPATLADVDLQDCRFTDILFVGLRLSGVRLPQRDSIVVVPQARRVLEQVRTAVAGRSDELPYLAFKVDYLLKHVGRDDDLYVDYDDINRGGGEASVALLREVISRAS